MSSRRKIPNPFNQNDLLNLPFSITNPAEGVIKSSSTELSFSDPVHESIKPSPGTIAQIFQSDSQNNDCLLPKSNQKVFFAKIQEPVIEKDSNVNQKLYNSEMIEDGIKQPNARMRRSSFFQVEDFSLSRQMYTNTDQFFEPTSFSHESKNQPESQIKSPYFGQKRNPMSFLMPRDFLGNPNMIFTKPKLETFLLSEDISFGIQRQTSPTKIQAKPILTQHNSAPQNQKKYEQKTEEKKEKVLHQHNSSTLPICFHCGKAHYYNQCTLNKDIALSSDIKCLNCKHQGHTARYCPQPPRCNHCNSTEHLVRDCPVIDANKKQKICLNCNQKGHFAKECTVPKKCFLCHQTGHQIKDCPRNKHHREKKDNQAFLKPKVCFNCQKQGHYANQCTQPQRCHNCQQQGHYSRDCPRIARFYSVDQKQENSGKRIREQSVQKPQSQPQPQAIKKKPFFSKFNIKKRQTSGKKQNQSNLSKKKSKGQNKVQKFERKQFWNK